MIKVSSGGGLGSLTWIEITKVNNVNTDVDN
jgi:hypothetical protein